MTKVEKEKRRMVILTLAVAFAIAALSGMGVGGGGLFVIYLSLFSDLPQLSIQGINLLFFLFASGASLLIHLWKRRIALWAVAILALSGLVGAVGGTALASAAEGDLLRKLFGGMLVLSGLYSIISAKRKMKK